MANTRFNIFLMAMVMLAISYTVLSQINILHDTFANKKGQKFDPEYEGQVQGEEKCIAPFDRKCSIPHRCFSKLYANLDTFKHTQTQIDRKSWPWLKLQICLKRTKLPQLTIRTEQAAFEA